jgi:hypothetical protein
MRRILLVLTAAMVIALMVVAMAVPAFAKINCTPNGEGELCSPASGGYGDGGQDYGGNGGGGGAHSTYDPNAPEGEPHVVISGGNGFGGSDLQSDSGGGGGHCVSYTSPNTFECKGTLYG